jgi:glutamate-1-semialdehyde 2,1-aminomutase
MTAALPTSDLARQMQRRAHALIPGGAHTYAKGDDQFPQNAPPFIVRGTGCHVWDLDGREFIEYGMGLRAVTLGHAFAPVVDAAMRQLPHGVNFTRPAPIELEAAELLHGLVPGAEMVKFCKDGSHAVDGAIRLARAATGRKRVAICADHPFFSTGDWFIGTGEMAAGIPAEVPGLVLSFAYNDRAGLQALFDAHPGEIACVLMEAARIDEPTGDYLHWVKQTAHAHGALLVFDEMITGFRWHLGGAQAAYGVTPDLATFGKALANGFSVSALVGRRDLMRLGGLDHDRERVFLLSTTHGAQTHELAAAIETMRFYRDHPVIETLHARGRRLREGIEQVAAAQGLSAQIGVVSRDCNLLFYTRDADGRPSQPLRTLFMQELVRHGILAPSFVVSWSHSEADIDRTIDAVARALPVYRQALEAGVEGRLVGPSVKPVFRRYA